MLDRPDEALAACDDALHRLCENDAPALLEQVAMPLVNTLMRISVDLGPVRVRDMIQASPAANFLLPLTTALEQEMELEHRVAREVEEIAEDIREKLADLKGSSKGR